MGYLDIKDKIYIAGHNGMVGSAIMRRLTNDGFNKIIVRNHYELDLVNQKEVETFFCDEKPDVVFLAAAKVGGIAANMKDPVSFLMENLIIETNVIKAAYNCGVKRLVFLGSSCIYPTLAKQPLKEEYLLTNVLEPTNEGYALAKIVGIKACEYYNNQYGLHYLSIMPPNLYGINDNFNLETAHIVAALIRRMHEAKKTKSEFVEIWGSGNQYRELMFVDDMVDAMIYVLENYKENGFINIGVGKDYTVKEIAEKIKKIVGYSGKLFFNTEKPDGMYRKILDVERLNNLGWKSTIPLEIGLKRTYEWYLASVARKGECINEN